MKARIAELRAENARKSELSRAEALRWLSDLIRTPIGSVGKDSPLVQAYEEDSEGNVKFDWLTRSPACRHYAG